MVDESGGSPIRGAAYRHEQSKRFVAHMLTLPRQDFCPRRDAFDPVAVAEFLPRIVLRSRSDDGTYQYRLMGTELAEYFGQEVTGKAIAEGMGAAPAAAMQTAFDRMIAQPCGLRCVMEVNHEAGQVVLLESATLPFSGAAPPQQIAHIAILQRPGHLLPQDPTTAGKLHELEGIDLGAGIADFTDISW